MSKLSRSRGCVPTVLSERSVGSLVSISLERIFPSSEVAVLEVAAGTLMHARAVGDLFGRF